MRRWVLLWVLWFFLCLGAEAAIRIDGKTPEVRLDSCVTVMEDSSGKLGIADVISPALAGRFTPVKSAGELHLGVSRSAWWLRCDLNLATMSETGHLEVGYSRLGFVDVYFARGDKVLSSALAGDMRPLSVRPLADRRFIFPVPMMAGDLSVFARVESAGPITVPMRWLSDTELERVTKIDLAVLAAYWGVLLALATYNLFLFFAVRAWSFLHYILSTIAYGFGLFILFGYAACCVWPEAPGMNAAAPIMVMSLAGIFGVLFTCSFFSTARRSPRVHRWLIGAAVAQIVGIGLSVISPVAGAVFFALVGNVVFVAMVIVVARGWRERWPGTLPFAVAFGIQVLVSLSQGMQSLGALPATLWTTYSLPLGSAGVAMLYALAIAVRLNAIKRDKETAQAQARASQLALVNSLRENERELERRVDARTKELGEVNAALRERERQLVDLAHYDTLTGAASRVLFEDRLLLAMARSVRSQRLMALLLIDLDEFKAVNDTYGHDAGDAVLVEIAHRFADSVRSIDTFGRLGGDEFVILIEDLSMPEDASRMAAKILREAARPVIHGGQSLQVGASIGIAFCPRDAIEMSELVKVADMAMYEAKRAGRGCWRRAPGQA